MKKKEETFEGFYGKGRGRKNKKGTRKGKEISGEREGYCGRIKIAALMNLKLMSIESRRKDKDFENFVGLQLGGGYRDKGPPSEVVGFFVGYITEVATFLHACEGDAVTKLCQEKIPYLNAPIYLQHKTQIGKVDEIFGPINESVCFSLSMRRIVATSYAEGDKFYIDHAKLLPLARFLPQLK
ncbi:hypothetical protein HID58_049522 [Brassica napus]|uniref:H/ACA ribonucleoprotein complex subunit n=1 Tax=Brassica napus TaxID=3708 RepID=A0ABQ8B598_BRANA|nr:hypothetical protein HID58_049522 [Brassica napus]